MLWRTPRHDKSKSITPHILLVPRNRLYGGTRSKKVYTMPGNKTSDASRADQDKRITKWTMAIRGDGFPRAIPKWRIHFHHDWPIQPMARNENLPKAPNSTTTIRAMKEIFANQGIPITCQSDNGPHSNHTNNRNSHAKRDSDTNTSHQNGREPTELLNDSTGAWKRQYKQVCWMQDPSVQVQLTMSGFIVRHRTVVPVRVHFPQCTEEEKCEQNSRHYKVPITVVDREYAETYKSKMTIKDNTAIS